MSRQTGEIWEFGSGQLFNEGLEFWLQFYAEGWRPGTYRLTIRNVMKPGRFARLLVDQHVSYLIREIECNTVWERTAVYDEDLILRRTRNLPCSFPVTAVHLRAIIPDLESEGIAIFEYAHVGNPKKYDWRPENNTEDQLGPQYDYA